MVVIVQVVGFPQKLALTTPTNGGRSVGIARLRTQATKWPSEFGRFTGVWIPHENSSFSCTNSYEMCHFFNFLVELESVCNESLLEWPKSYSSED
jgi:hypothetical protein